MRRHLGIILAALAVVLSACTDEAPPPPGPVITTPPVIETVVAHPKYVDEKTRCTDFIWPDEVSAATGTLAKLRSDAAFGCDYNLTRSDGKRGGELIISLCCRIGPSGGLPVVATTVSGNTAIEQRGNPGVCDFWVIIDGSLPPGAMGGILWIQADLETDADACRAARELVEKAFARLPDA
jgi:hypothetical protein